MKRSAGMSGACVRAISEFVLAGLPTTSTLMSSAAPALSASPCGLKIAPLASSRSARSMPFDARARADQQRDVAAVERLLGVVVDVDAGEQRERAVEQLERGALGGLDRVRDLEQVEVDLRVRAEHLPGGDAEQDGVADGAGGAGDGDLLDGHQAQFISFWRFCVDRRPGTPGC